MHVAARQVARPKRTSKHCSAAALGLNNRRAAPRSIVDPHVCLRPIALNPDASRAVSPAARSRPGRRTNLREKTPSNQSLLDKSREFRWHASHLLAPRLHSLRVAAPHVACIRNHFIDRDRDSIVHVIRPTVVPSCRYRAAQSAAVAANSSVPDRSQENPDNRRPSRVAPHTYVGTYTCYRRRTPGRINELQCLSIAMHAAPSRAQASPSRVRWKPSTPRASVVRASSNMTVPGAADDEIG